jgi:DNA primase small subunit
MSSPRAVKDEPMDDGSAIPEHVAEVVTKPENDVDMNEIPEADEGAKKDVKLEDLFKDVESDDEFPSSAPVERPQIQSSPPSTEEALPVYDLLATTLCDYDLIR